MKKIVSKKNVKFKNGKHMSGQEIADKLNISRAAVSQTLKRSIEKVFISLKKKNKNQSNIKIMSVMANEFNIQSNIEYQKFFRLFPERIKRNIYDEAKKIGYI